MDITDNNQPSLLSFPCPFSIKIIGKANSEFEGAVMQIMRRHVPNLSEGAIEENYSKESNYVSMTVTIVVDSQEQLDAIYRDLSADSRVMMAL